MTLSSNRINFITASQCHTIMGGYKEQAKLRGMEKPNIDGIDLLISKIEEAGFTKAPLIGDLKALGWIMKGAQKDELWRYIRSQKEILTEPMISKSLELALRYLAPNAQSRKKNITTSAMEYGTENEHKAVEWLEKQLGIKFDNTCETDQAFFYRELNSVTPDGVYYEDFEVSSLLEVKCFQAENHLRHLYNINKPEDLYEVSPRYYGQMQCGLYIVPEASHYDFCCWNKDFDDKMNLHVIVERDEDYISELVIRSKTVFDLSIKIEEIVRNKFK